MTDLEARRIHQERYIERYLDDAISFSNMLSSFEIEAGLTRGHLLIAQTFKSDERRLLALKWAADARANPLEMRAWDRLENSEDN